MTTEQNKKKSASHKLETMFGPLTIAKLLVAHRESLNLPQVQMAKKLKLTSQKLCDFEKGRRLPSAEVAEKWALILKLSPKVWVEAVLREQISGCKTIKHVQVA
ncbi:MAG: helix-turn-helix domain-containing protein [Bdellovibrio sp.]